MIVRLHDVTVAYGDNTALREVDLEADSGSIVAVVGGDGAGKSTLLKVITSVVRPRAGEIVVPSREVIGYVPATSGVYRDLTCVENLEFVGGAYRVSGSRLGARIDELLERTGLDEARDRLGGNLSGGMRQKLAVAMALVHDPELLVLDEPSTGVDPVSRRELWSLFKDSIEGGAAIVLSTTYLDEAERAASLVVLDDGEILTSGAPSNVISAAPGFFFDAAERPQAGRVLAWRRGARWRVWDDLPDGGERRVNPDLQDAVTLAALRKRGAREAAA